MGEPKTFTKTITVDLDAESSAKLGRELCQVLEEIEVAKTYRKEFNSEMKEKLDSLTVKQKELKAAIEKGKFEEHIECYEEQDFDTSSIKTIRKSDGLIVDQRAMTADERRAAMQKPLPFTSDGGGPNDTNGKVLPFGHTHEDASVYTEGCSVCWAQKERPPMPPVDDETALAESIGPGNELPEPPPSDEELDAEIDANVAPDVDDEPLPEDEDDLP